MCLRTRNNKQQIAQYDIPIYKVLTRRNSGVYTPYSDTFIPTETLNGQKPFVANGKVSKEIWRMGNGSKKYSVEGGMIHTYANLSDAWWCAYHVQRWGFAEVYACIIPKGTPYYYGTDYIGTQVYASKQIRFVKRLQNPNTPKPIQTELDFC